jgi:glycine/D-amino acid oxidase-like deaminating enzyme
MQRQSQLKTIRGTMDEYDAIIVGGGIAGLWLGNALLRAGYNVILVEKDALGGTQTLASQGMIHGGQKYLLAGSVTSQAAAISKMPQRWQACFEGRGEVDLSGVRFLSEIQVMWPAGSILSAAAVLAAAKFVNAAPARLGKDEVPAALKDAKFGGPVYRLPEKVLDVRSLVDALAARLRGRLFKGEVIGIEPDGRVTVANRTMRAQAIVFAAGTGNERAFDLLGVKEPQTQRRPLRQIMVRPLSHPLFGHGIVASARPRVSITAHACGDREYVWYLGGDVAEKAAEMAQAQALQFAKRELTEIFPAIDWGAKQWATWYGDRAEPLEAKGELPAGPVVRQHGRILVGWPTKLTFAPALSDLVLARLHDIKPRAASDPPPLPPPRVGAYPWEVALWSTAG